MYLGVKEKPIGSNRGDDVDRFNAYLNMKAVPWCATCQSYIQQDGNLIRPLVKSARAISFKTGEIYNVKDIELGNYSPKSGDYLVKARRGGNHVDQVLFWNEKETWGLLIGCNVSDRIKIRRFDLDDMLRWGASITKVQGNYNYTVTEKGMQLIKENLLNAGYDLSFKYGLIN